MMKVTLNKDDTAWLYRSIHNEGVEMRKDNLTILSLEAFKDMVLRSYQPWITVSIDPDMWRELYKVYGKGYRANVHAVSA